ncbi:LysR family transcriptional regulator [Streptomyces sp. NPDC096311]|uniref:LysR family transcriptional regulator n=1 Tax=Streptomyces sp. NPDC096311 TaxID=3366083 RepID=UPI003827EC82
MSFDNRFSLYKLEVFCCVVEASGVGRAAERLFVTQPVVSAHLRSLQEHLGVRLFEREGRGVRLTKAGSAAYDWAREMLSRTHQISRELEDLEAGLKESLIVVAGPSLAGYVLPPIVCRLRVQHPDIRIALRVAEPAQALTAVRSGDADVAVVMCLSPADLDGLDVESIGREELALVAQPDHPRAGSMISPGEMGDLDLITSCSDQPTEDLLAGALAAVGYPMPVATTDLGHPEAIKLAVREGCGAALLMRSAVDRDLAVGDLCEITLSHTPTVPVYATRRAGRERSWLHVDFVEEALARRTHSAPGAGPIEQVDEGTAPLPSAA